MMAERNRYYIITLEKKFFHIYPSLYHFKIVSKLKKEWRLLSWYSIYFNLSLKISSIQIDFPPNELNVKNTLLSPLSLVYIESKGGSRDTMRNLVTWHNAKPGHVTRFYSIVPVGIIRRHIRVSYHVKIQLSTVEGSYCRRIFIVIWIAI